MVGKKFKKSLFGGLFLGLAAMLIVTSPALAVDKYWVGPADPPGVWSVDTNWYEIGVPAPGDDVFIAQPGANVSYLNPSNPTLKSLRLDPSGPQTGEVDLTQAQDILTVKNTKIGYNRTASYFHDGGTHKVLHDLTLGTAADGEGYYYLNGGSLSVGGHETLGRAGKGYLFQLGLKNSLSSGRPPSLECTPPVPPPPPVGPTHSVGKNLYLGFESGSEGEVLLTDSGLTVGGSARVAIQGAGRFEQTDSIVKIKGNYYPDPSDPQVGEGILSSSPLFSAISKKNLKNNKLECVSNREPGLIVGLENKGKYLLTGGTLNVNFGEIIGLVERGEGTFIQSDGAHTINGNLYLGKEVKSLGDYFLSVQNPDTPTSPEVGLLDVHGFASVGYLGTGSFSQDGGTVKIGGIDQKANLRGKSLSTTLSKGASLSCSQNQYIGFTVGRGGTGVYYLDDGELLVSHGEVIGMVERSNGTFEQIGGKHFIGGNLTIARDEGSSGRFTLGDPDRDPESVTLSGGTLKVQGSLLNNKAGIFEFYDGELLASVINKGTFNAYGSVTPRAFANQFFNYGTFEIQGQPSGTASFAQKFRNYGVYKSTWISGKSAGTGGTDSRFTYLYIGPKGYIVAGATDNYYVTKEFTNTSTKNEDWKTETANLIFTGPGRKPFKTGSDKSGDFTNNFAWGSVGIEGNGSVRLFDHLYADQIRGVEVNAETKKITNLLGYCGIHIYYDTKDANNSYLNDWILTTTYGKPVGKFTSSGFDTFKNCY